MTFLDFFINKVSDIRLGISPPVFDPSVLSVCSAEFSHFEPIPFIHLQEIVCQLSVSVSVRYLPPCTALC